MNNRLIAGSMVGVLFAIAAPAGAHHSFAMFDLKNAVTISGVVKSFEWTNPHVWIEVDVSDAKGKTVTWKIEGGGVSSLRRQGWTGKSFVPGMNVAVTVNPLRNGEPGGSFVYAKFEDGRVLGKAPAGGESGS